MIKAGDGDEHGKEKVKASEMENHQSDRGEKEWRLEQMEMCR